MQMTIVRAGERAPTLFNYSINLGATLDGEGTWWDQTFRFDMQMRASAVQTRKIIWKQKFRRLLKTL